MCNGGVDLEYIRVNVTLEPGDVEKLARLERETGKSRSELIREAVRSFRPQTKRTINREEALRLLETVHIDLPADPVTMIRSMRDGQRTW